MANGKHPLERLVELLKPETSGGPRKPTDPEALQQALLALAQWRLACGDLRGAADWQQATLQPADPNELRRALLPLLHDRSDLRRDLEHRDTNWLPLLRALLRGHYAKAASLQTALLGGNPPPEPPLETLLRSWLQAGYPERALELLDACPEAAPEQIGDATTASAIAWTLQAAQRQQEATPWWQHCLTLDPQRSAVAEMLKNLVTSTNTDTMDS